nr:immunoglobulin heavy chain junction region [Mus musculus]MBK4186557.1 immunoglobulin heavy chain junction region [Mus musculus]
CARLRLIYGFDGDAMDYW